MRRKTTIGALAICFALSALINWGYLVANTVLFDRQEPEEVERVTYLELKPIPREAKPAPEPPKLEPDRERKPKRKRLRPKKKLEPKLKLDFEELPKPEQEPEPEKKPPTPPSS